MCMSALFRVPSIALTRRPLLTRTAGVLVVVAVLFPSSRALNGQAPDPIQFGGNAAHTGAYPTEGLDGYGGVLWRADLGGPIRSAPAVTDGRVYIGSASGHLYALDRWTGREIWRYRADGAVHGSPAVWNGLVFTTDGAGTLHAVDVTTGEARWRVETGPLLPWAWGHESGDLYLSSPLLAEVEGEMRLWFGAGDGKLYAVAPADGEVIWSLQTEGRIRSTPAYADGTVVVGSADGSVYAASASNGAALWRHDTPGRALDSGDFGFDRKTVQSSPAIVDGQVYVGTRSGSLFALDLRDGSEIWESSHGSSWVNGGPAAAAGRVFAGSSDGRFIQAVDAATGEELWRRDSGVTWSSPVVVDSAVHFTESSGVIRAFDVETGETLWWAILPDDTWASPVVDDGVLFVGSDDGLYALRGAEGRPFHKAVYWDSTYTRARWYLGHEALADDLEDQLYDLLDAGALAPWLRARIEDREPSTLVIALDRLPDAVRGDSADPASSLLRRYLEAGGTVVAPGLPLTIWPRDIETGEDGGLAAVRWDEASERLGIDLGAASFDYVGARATPAGRALGLPASFLAHWTVDPQPELEPLALDENGRYAAWRRSYGGAPGTGLVRIWPSRRELPDLTPLVVAAEYRPLDPERDELSEATRIGRVLDHFAREGMERLGVPGLSFGGVTTDGVVFERGWGVRDAVEGGRVDPRTSFYIASSTKSFVGLTAALLDLRGRLDLDAPLAACLPGLDLEGTADPSSITLRDHLRHTPGWENGMVEFRTAYTDLLQPTELRDLLTRTSTVEDGGHFSYDNIGFVIADLCFREQIGADWKELVEAEVLVPLGMSRTTPYMSRAVATGNFAFPHVWDGVRHRRIPPKTDDIMHAAGGLVTTASDAGRWVRALLGEGFLDGEQVFPASAVREVLTRQVDADLSFWEFTREGYGLGWFDGRYRGERLVHHFGGYPGAQAHISLMPERGMGAVAFVNGGGGNGYLLPHLVAALFYDLMLGAPDAERHAYQALDSAVVDAEEYLQAQREANERRERLTADAEPIEEAERYVGLYRSPARGNMTVMRAPGGKLRIRWGSALRGPLVPAGDGTFLALWETRSPDRISFDLSQGTGPAGALSFDGFSVPRVGNALPGG